MKHIGECEHDKAVELKGYIRLKIGDDGDENDPYRSVGWITIGKKPLISVRYVQRDGQMEMGLNVR